MSPLARWTLMVKCWLESFFAAYLNQILGRGIFHAGIRNPGNVFLTGSSPNRVVLPTWMWVGIMPSLQEDLLAIVARNLPRATARTQHKLD